MIPTPRNQEDYERLNNVLQKFCDELNEKGIRNKIYGEPEDWELDPYLTFDSICSDEEAYTYLNSDRRISNNSICWWCGKEPMIRKRNWTSGQKHFDNGKPSRITYNICETCAKEIGSIQGAIGVQPQISGPKKVNTNSGCMLIILIIISILILL